METQSSVELLSARFNRCFATFTADPDLFSDDAFFDLLPPLWRFQLVGPEAFLAQIKAIAEGPVRVKIVRTIPTATGFVTEHEERQDVSGSEVVARRIWLCEVRDGRIVDVTGYCNGGWDEELRARHAAEAPPMLRP